MKALNKPDFRVREVFTECINSIRSVEEKMPYVECIEILEQSEKTFEIKFIQNKIFEINPSDNILGPIGKRQMTTIYDYRMVNRKMPACKYYNQIKASAPFGKCPLCSVRIVDTLDHYLPKSKFPVFAVTPINLVPSCSVCNKGKSVDYPRSSYDQTLNPYFDNVENIEWVKSRLIYNKPLSFEYFVDPPIYWSQTLKERVNCHFSSFNLSELFSTHANEEFRGIKKQLRDLYENHPSLLQSFLLDCYESRLVLGVNSWQAVMYKALAYDQKFCNGGVLFSSD